MPSEFSMPASFFSFRYTLKFTTLVLCYFLNFIMYYL